MNHKQKDVLFMTADELGFDPIQNTFGESLRNARRLFRTLSVDRASVKIWKTWPQYRQLVRIGAMVEDVANGTARVTGNERDFKLWVAAGVLRSGNECEPGS